jgi:hypothetical protein
MRVSTRTKRRTAPLEKEMTRRHRRVLRKRRNWDEWFELVEVAKADAQE